MIWSNIFFRSGAKGILLVYYKKTCYWLDFQIDRKRPLDFEKRSKNVSLLFESHFDDQDIIKAKTILDVFFPFTQKKPSSEKAITKYLLGNGIYCNQTIIQKTISFV